jgi:hypothetical protein
MFNAGKNSHRLLPPFKASRMRTHVCLRQCCNYYSCYHSPSSPQPPSTPLPPPTTTLSTTSTTILTMASRYHHDTYFRHPAPPALILLSRRHGGRQHRRHNPQSNAVLYCNALSLQESLTRSRRALKSLRLREELECIAATFAPQDPTSVAPTARATASCPCSGDRNLLFQITFSSKPRTVFIVPAQGLQCVREIRGPGWRQAPRCVNP